MAVEVGGIYSGKIVKVMPFGAFVRVESGESGLIHISEIDRQYVEDINTKVKVGDKVKVKLIEIADDGKMNFSIKKAMEQPREKRKETVREEKKPVRPAEIDWSRKQEDMSLDDMLSRFKKDSDENMQAIKRSNESKRSGGYRRGGGRY